jgi:hypothetical protein
MRVHWVLTAVTAALAFNACANLDEQWRWHRVSVQDQAEIRAALRRITTSPIVALQPHSPYDVPTLMCFYTADDKIYCGEEGREMAYLRAGFRLLIIAETI